MAASPYKQFNSIDMIHGGTYLTQTVMYNTLQSAETELHAACQDICCCQSICKTVSHRCHVVHETCV